MVMGEILNKTQKEFASNLDVEVKASIPIHKPVKNVVKQIKKVWKKIKTIGS